MKLSNLIEGISFDKKAISYIENTNHILMGLELEFKDVDNSNYQLISDDMEFENIEEIVAHSSVHPKFELNQFKKVIKQIANKEEIPVKELLEKPNTIAEWLTMIPMFGNTHNIGYLFNLKEYLEDHGIIIDNVVSNNAAVKKEWALEFDSDLIEIKSAPMNFKKASSDLLKILKFIVYSDTLTMDEECGLHINISMKNTNMNDVDWLKFLIVLDEEYFLKYFNRTDNHNTMPMLVKGKSNTELKQVVDNYIKTSFKNFSLSFRDTYMEVRIAGGEKIVSELGTTMRYLKQVAFALLVASDENAYRNEYMKKLYKLEKSLEPLDKD